MSSAHPDRTSSTSSLSCPWKHSTPPLLSEEGSFLFPFFLRPLPPLKLHAQRPRASRTSALSCLLPLTLRERTGGWLGWQVQIRLRRTLVREKRTTPTRRAGHSDTARCGRWPADGSRLRADQISTRSEPRLSLGGIVRRVVFTTDEERMAIGFRVFAFLLVPFFFITIVGCG